MDRKDLFLNLSSYEDLAAFLKVDVFLLKYTLYVLPDEKKYKRFFIKKKNGGTREISTPHIVLKYFQERISEALYDIYEPRTSTKGFVKHESIISNAQPHLRQKFVLNIDLLDFFGSINFGRVRGLFLSPPFNFETQIATVLAQICCFNNKLPQGAPTSPVISNMICSRLDKQLYQAARKNRIRYTRYADDITFSSGAINLPAFMGEMNAEYEFVLNQRIQDIIEKNGFKTNFDKVRLQSSGEQQTVTGLKVNSIINVQRKYVKQIKSILYSWKKYGYENAEAEHAKYYKRHKWDGAMPPLKNILIGKIMFLKQVKGYNDPLFRNLVQYARHVDFKSFQVPFSPLDKIYFDFLSLQSGMHKGERIDSIKRGFVLEQLLVALFQYFKIPTIGAFRRNDSGEQIDGAFKNEGWHFLFECKWKAKKSDHAELSSLENKVSRSGKQTMGVFISIKGWSSNVVSLLKQNPAKHILLMDGKDLLAVLSGDVNFTDLIAHKLEALNVRSEPYAPASELSKPR